jgi:hypothetical protein
VVKRIYQKLAARYYGPFQITEKYGAVAYKLALPLQSKIHPVFHVSLLKKAVGNYQVQGELPKDLEISSDDDIYPKKVLGSRVTIHEGKTVSQSLIQWKNKSLDEVTWEDNDFLKGQFPTFSLEDKTVFMGEGVDRNLNNEMGLDCHGPKPPVWRVYSRRKKE